MELNKQTYGYQFGLLNQQYTAIIINLQAIQRMAGLSKETIEKQHNLTNLSHDIKKQLDVKINLLRSNNKQLQNGTEFNSFITELENLIIESKELLLNAELDSKLTKKVQNAFEVNKEDFMNAMKHHKWLSYIMVIILFLIIISSGFVIWFVFLNSNENFEDIGSLAEIIGDLKLDKEFLTKVIYLKIALKFIGRISFIAILYWVVLFIGKLHNKHISQYISYQDKLSGLSTAELIISSGNYTTREKILLTMTETYLSLNENDFIKKDKSEINKKDLLNALKLFLKKVTFESKK